MKGLAPGEREVREREGEKGGRVGKMIEGKKMNMYAYFKNIFYINTHTAILR